MAKQLLVDFMILHGERKTRAKGPSACCVGLGKGLMPSDVVLIGTVCTVDCLRHERKGRIGISSVILVISKYEIPMEYQAEKTRSG